MNRTETLEVVSINRETGEQEMLSMLGAVFILSSFWKKEEIESELRKGTVLWNPYYEFKIQNNKGAWHVNPRRTFTRKLDISHAC